jgi:hypothetical protein
MKRLFSAFVNGLPGLGLLLLRVIGGAALIVQCLRLAHGSSPQMIIPHVIAAAGGVLLLMGLRTSLGAAIVVISELWIAFAHSHDPWVGVLLATIGTALALLGPGAWSVDARRLGWQRIEIRRPDK